VDEPGPRRPQPGSPQQPSASPSGRLRRRRPTFGEVLDLGGPPSILDGVRFRRDIVVKALARGRDPASTRAGELGQGKPVTIGADDSLQEALRTMAQYKVRRLPVIDGHDLVGIVAVADIARELGDDDSKGDLIEAISEGPPQQGVGPQ
jgi:CBS domain